MLYKFEPNNDTAEETKKKLLCERYSNLKVQENLVG